MARKITYICDRCKKEYDKRNLLPYGYPQLSVHYEYKGNDVHNDLCMECQKSLKKWMDKDDKLIDNDALISIEAIEENVWNFAGLLMNGLTENERHELTDGNSLFYTPYHVVKARYEGKMKK